MSGKRNTFGKLGRIACALVLAVSLCSPYGFAIADESTVSPTVSDHGEVASAERKALILEEAREAEMDGFNALEKYLSDEGLSDEDVLSIDIEALGRIDASLAGEIAHLQAEVRARQESPDSDNGATVEEADGAEGDEAQKQDPDKAGDGATDEVKDDAMAEEPEGTEIDEAQKLDSDEIDGDAVDEATHGKDPMGSPEDGEQEEAAGVAQDGKDAKAARSEAETRDGAQYPSWSYDGDASIAPRSYSINLTTAKFIAVIGEPARQLAEEHDLYASVMIAQAILESGSGGSGLSQPPYFNLFGIKGAFEGQSVTMSTQEDDGSGRYYTIDAAFRSYPSYRESLADYAELLSKPYYAPARKASTDSYIDACNYLQGTYATSTSYSASLQGIIEAYDLTRYDEPLDYELIGEYVAVVDAESGEVLAWGEEGLAEYAEILSREGQDEVLVEERDLVDLIMQASSQLGLPYVWGGTGPLGYDCSGLIQSSYMQALGVALPRTTHYQCLQGDDVDFKDLHMGDLLFFVDEKGVVGHVGMYLGEGCYIESTTGGVQVTALEERPPTFAKRMLATRDKDVDVHLESIPRNTLAFLAYRTVPERDLTFDQVLAERMPAARKAVADARLEPVSKDALASLAFRA